MKANWLHRSWHWVIITFILIVVFSVFSVVVISFSVSSTPPRMFTIAWQGIKPILPDIQPRIVNAANPSPTSTATINFIRIGQAEFFASSTVSPTPYQPLPPTSTHTYTPSPTATFTPSPSPTSTSTFTPSPSPTPPATATLAPTSTTAPEEPTAQPTIDPGGSEFPPPSFYIQGVPGHNMYYSLDCETRSAVDLAAYFGISIDHQQFLDSLPYTDDPETGYVGSYRDPAGNIPPYSYGVHSPPIAALLNQYGLNAQSRKGLSLDELIIEIASGRPVMVWVVGSVQYGTPQSYTAESTGNTTIVAAYEHTVLVVGYDENYIYIQDGYQSYYRSRRQFLASWGVLGYMAVTVQP